jgi:mannose-6-phosphate isomerase-like protein (cupin superfamily)
VPVNTFHSDRKDEAMSASPPAPAPDQRYETHLDIPFRPLELVDLQPVIDGVRHPWFNQTLCKVNDSVVRLGVVQGEYHWHKHDADDEFFYVVDGRLIIDWNAGGERSIELGPRQGFVIPKGVVHRTRAREKTIMLMVETATIVPTGD